MLTRRKASRSPDAGFRPGVEGLERRDCPAVVSITGPADTDENGAAVTLTATLSEAQSRPVEVRYFTAGTATGGRDYRLAIGNSGLTTPSGSFTFRPGQVSVSIRLTPVNDIVREATETFQFNLLSARGHTIGVKSVAGTIRDDDSFTAAIVGPTRVAAGAAHTFTLQLSSAATKRETFFLSTEDRSASTPDDYSPFSNLPLTFQPGEISKTFSVAIRPNMGLEPDESFVVTVRPESRDVPSVAPFTITIIGSGSPSPPSGPPLTTATFSHDYGWGVVNASAAVAKLLDGSTALPEVADLGGVNWGNDIVRAPEVWARGYTGQGIVVAVVDTGVDYTHPSLLNSIWVNAREVPSDGIDNDNNGFVDDVRGWDFADDDNDPMDEIRSGGGHGTHVAGTVAATGSAYGPKGVAPAAKIMPIRFFGADNTDDDLAQAIRYAATNGAHVINLSLGYRGLSSGPAVVADAMSYATSLGSVIVVAAGNDAQSEPSFPASLATRPGVISVGAIDATRTITSFSHRAGFSPSLKQVVAPGKAIVSTVPTGFSHPVYQVSVTPGGTFASFDGTSMAAPHTAGVVALMLGSVPNPRAPGVRERVVNALVSTSQQPAAATTSAAASLGSSGRVNARTSRSAAAFYAPGSSEWIAWGQAAAAETAHRPQFVCDASPYGNEPAAPRRSGRGTVFRG